MFSYDPVWGVQSDTGTRFQFLIRPSVDVQTDTDIGFQCSHMTLCGVYSLIQVQGFNVHI